MPEVEKDENQHSIHTDGQKNNIMTISWTMVMGFTPIFAMTTGPWNYSYAALLKTKECVISIPTVDLIDRVIGVGTCSGADTDKFAVSVNVATQ